MAKATSYTKVQNISLDIRLNWPANTADGTPGYAPAVIRTYMQAVTEDGGVRDIQQQAVVGTVRTTEYTPTELANIVKGSNNSTGNTLLAELTKAYTEALGGL